MDYIKELASKAASNVELLKGKAVIGSMCLFSPREIVHCLGATARQLSWFAGFVKDKDLTIAAINRKIFSDDICLHCKTYYLPAGPGLYPEPKLFIFPTTCDPLTKMYSYLADSYQVYYLKLPRNRKAPEALQYWKEQIHELALQLEMITGQKLSLERLVASVQRHNRARALMRSLMDLRKNDPPLLSSTDARQIQSIFMALDPEDSIPMLEGILAYAQAKAAEVKPSHRPRVMYISTTTRDLTLRGTSSTTTTQQLIEESGGSLVCEEACSNQLYENEIPLAGNLEAQTENIATFYLQKIYCPCFTDLDIWFESVTEKIKQYRIDGVIIRSLKFCRHMNGQLTELKNILHQQGKPTLIYESSGEIDTGLGKLRTQIEAFIAMAGQES